MSSDPLPSFLTPSDLSPNVASSLPESAKNAFFTHRQPLGSGHAHWWSFTNSDASDRSLTVLVFIPGNPGLLGFYTPFLSAIHDKARSSSNRSLAILSHSHLGHTPHLVDDAVYSRPEPVSLSVQIEAAIEVVDAVKSEFGARTKIVLAGHSVGAWVALQTLKARPDVVDEAFFLFPTISHIARTPNGRRLSWFFHSPLPRIIANISVLTRLLPDRALSFLFHDWPSEQLSVLRSLLHSPPSIFACLTMAHEEMNTIGDLDVALLNEHRHRICFYFADLDGWVGEQKDAILKAFHPDTGAVRIVHGHPDIPHAFCINHGEPLAAQCYEWLDAAGLV